MTPEIWDWLEFAKQTILLLLLLYTLMRLFYVFELLSTWLFIAVFGIFVGIEWFTWHTIIGTYNDWAPSGSPWANPWWIQHGWIASLVLLTTAAAVYRRQRDW